MGFAVSLQRRRGNKDLFLALLVAFAFALLGISAAVGYLAGRGAAAGRPCATCTPGCMCPRLPSGKCLCPR